MASVQSTGAQSSSFVDSFGQSNASSATSKSSDPQDRFLTLLIAQLKNQDPMNPLDNAQMTSQLAQMSTVSGIEKLNSTLNSLVNSLGDSQSMQAAQMIGKNVLIAGSSIQLVESGEPAEKTAFGGFKLDIPAERVKISVVDSAGKVLNTQELERREAGNYLFSWNGECDDGTIAEPGSYKFKVEAFSGNNTVSISPMQIGTVSALVRSGNGFRLDLGALGLVDFKDVQQIL